MVEGQVGYHRPENVRRMSVEKNNSIVNALNKTKTELYPDLYQQQQDRQREMQMAKKQARREEEKLRKEQELKQKQIKEERSYDRIMSGEKMLSNAGRFLLNLLGLF